MTEDDAIARDYEQRFGDEPDDGEERSDCECCGAAGVVDPRSSEDGRTMCRLCSEEWRAPRLALEAAE